MYEDPVDTRNSYRTISPYPAPLLTGPVTARPTGSSRITYQRPSLNQPNNYTNHRSGPDSTTTIHRVRTVTKTISTHGCTIKAQNANFIFWDTNTYSTTFVLHDESELFSTLSVSLNTLELPSFGAATTKIITVGISAHVISRSSYTSTAVVAGYTYTYTPSGSPTGITEEAADLTEIFTSASDILDATTVLGPEVVSKGVTKAFTMYLRCVTHPRSVEMLKRTDTRQPLTHCTRYFKLSEPLQKSGVRLAIRFHQR